MGAKTAGVYAIYLTGTPYAYVGESARVPARLRIHQAAWVWPNAAEYVLVCAMPGSTQEERRRAEAALARLLRRKGYLLLSSTFDEQSAAARDARRRLNPARRREIGQLGNRALRATLTPEQHRANSRLGGPAGRARWERMTPVERTALARSGGIALMAKLTPEERRARARAANAARWARHAQ